MEVLCNSSSGFSWNIEFSCGLYDWEVDMLGHLMMVVKEIFLFNFFSGLENLGAKSIWFIHFEIYVLILISVKLSFFFIPC